MKDRTWRRLRIVGGGSASTEDRVRKLARDLLKLETPARNDTRLGAASYLLKIADSAKALQAIDAKGGGRPREDRRHADIALDYLATKRRLGRGKSEIAKTEVGKAWSVSKEVVRDAFTNWRASAEYMLTELLESAKRSKLTESVALRYVSLDVRDIGLDERHGRDAVIAISKKNQSKRE